MPQQPSSDAQRVILHTLGAGPATLAGIRRAFEAADSNAKALPSMGEPDPLGEQLTELVLRGLVIDDDGHYRLSASH